MPGNLITIIDADGEMATVTGGKLDVNATVSGSGDGAIQDGANATIEATVFDLTNSNPLAVSVRDANGDLASLGGGTQYTEDAVAAADPVGTAIILVRQDAPATLVTTDGDNVAARGTNYGAQYAQIVTSAGAYVDSFGGGTQYTEDAAAAADPVGNALILVRDDALSGQTSLDGDNVATRGTDKGELYVKHVDSIPVTDSGGSLTIDAASLPLPTGASTAALQLADGHNVTVDNAAGAAAVNVQDGGNSLTVDNATISVVGGGVEATAQRVTIASDSTGVLSVDDNGGSLTIDNAQLSVIGSGTEAAAMRVTIATDSTGVLSIDDNGGAITVDGTVAVTGVATAANQATEITSLQLIDDAAVVLGTATYTEATSTGLAVGAVRRDADTTLVNTTNEWGPLQMDANGRLKVEAFSGETLPVSGTVTVNQGASAATAWEVIGDVATDIGVPANAVTIGGRASTAVPTAVSADGDSVNFWLNRLGMMVASGIPGLGLNADPLTLTSKTAQYTTTQTSAVLLAGGASDRIIVTSLQIGAGGTTAGTMQVYFGTGAYSRGTSLALFDHEFAPSATLKPGFYAAPPSGFRPGALGDDVLVTTSANMTVTVTIWYYLLAL